MFWGEQVCKRWIMTLAIFADWELGSDRYLRFHHLDFSAAMVQWLSCYDVCVSQDPGRNLRLI